MSHLVARASASMWSWFSAALASATPPTDPLGPVSQNPDDVRDAACRLVATSAVCDAPPPPDTVVTRPPNTSAGGGADLLGVLLWLLLAAVVAAAVIVAVRFFADRRPASDDLEDLADPDDDALAGTVVIDRSREPGTWRELAEEHRRHGRYRDSIRCRYRALVGDLARRGLLDEIPGRTTGEERAELRVSAPNAVPFFREAADLFDDAWYGHITVAAADDDRFQQLDRDVLTSARPLPHRVPNGYAEQAGAGAGGELR